MQRQALDNFHNLSPSSDNDYVNVSHHPRYLRNAKELLTAKELTDLK